MCLTSILRQMRLEAGLRQSDLAARLNEPQSFVSKYEAGERRLDVLELRHICKALEVSMVSVVEMLEACVQEVSDES